MNLLSIVMCNYNHAQYLPESIEAILGQSYQNIELIIIEDCSTDNSVGIIQKYCTLDERVKMCRNPKNIGVLASANKGLSMASGDFLYFASADDRICGGFFEKTIELFTKHPNAGICSGLVYLIDSSGKNAGWMKSSIVSSKEAYINPAEVDSLLKTIGSWFAGQTVVYRKKFFDELDLVFINELHHRADHLFNYLIASKYGACFYPEIMATYRMLEHGYASKSFSNIDISRQSFENLILKLKSQKYENCLTKEAINLIEYRGRIENELQILRELFLKYKFALNRMLENSNSCNELFKVIVIRVLIFMHGGLFNFVWLYTYILRMNGKFAWIFDKFAQHKFNIKLKKTVFK